MTLMPKRSASSSMRMLPSSITTSAIWRCRRCCRLSPSPLFLADGPASGSATGGLPGTWSALVGQVPTRQILPDELGQPLQERVLAGHHVLQIGGDGLRGDGRHDVGIQLADL